jgi:hypothetical protein
MEDEMDGNVARRGRKRNTYTILVGILQAK